ncbi:hypothetical protein [Dongia sp.]|uniref:hypothetical protein n=1 Tax=Dongia sp. TaxID=1977262 RepID=UPI0035B01C2E
MAFEPRLADLLAAIGPRHRKAWWKHIETVAVERDAAECALAHLPDEAWLVLKGNIIGQIDRRQPARGWPQMRDLLHEARAFRYLDQLGCTEIAFARRSMLAKSPDLSARRGTRRVLCEVKTIRLKSPDKLSPDKLSPDKLPPTFPTKLCTRLLAARKQLAADDDATALRLIYLILDRDDALLAEIAELATKSLPAGLNLVIDSGTRITEIT